MCMSWTSTSYRVIVKKTGEEEKLSKKIMFCKGKKFDVTVSSTHHVAVRAKPPR